MELHAYLSFNGQCKEALESYGATLGGGIVESYPYSDNEQFVSQLPERW